MPKISLVCIKKEYKDHSLKLKFNSSLMLHDIKFHLLCRATKQRYMGNSVWSLSFAASQ